MPVRRSRHLEGGRCGQERELWSQRLSPWRFRRRYFTSVPQFPHLYTGSLMVAASTDHWEDYRRLHVEGSSLVAQWLAFQASATVARVQSLVRELRSCKLRGTAPQKKRLNVENAVTLSARDGCPHKL